MKQMKRAMPIAPITQPTAFFGGSSDIREEVLPFCEANSIGVIVYSPLQAACSPAR